MRKLKRWIVLGVAFALTMGLAGCGKSADNGDATEKGGKTIYRTLDEIKKDGTINIGVFSDKNPFGYVDENGDYQGYDVYFADRLAKDLGVYLLILLPVSILGAVVGRRVRYAGFWA